MRQDTITAKALQRIGRKSVGVNILPKSKQCFTAIKGLSYWAQEFFKYYIAEENGEGIV
jgi:hypothetical protein